MKILLITLTILTIGCSTDKKEAIDTSKHFGDLTQDEQLKLFGQLSHELKGDFLTYSGHVIFDDTSLQTLDSSTFVELVMDNDNHFAIRTKSLESEIKTDSGTFHLIGGQLNNGFGKWADLGDKIELKFQLGTVDSYFDIENNKDKILIIDNYTLHLDKTVDEIWIWKTSCKKLGE